MALNLKCALVLGSKFHFTHLVSLSSKQAEDIFCLNTLCKAFAQLNKGSVSKHTGLNPKHHEWNCI